MPRPSAPSAVTGSRRREPDEYKAGKKYFRENRPGLMQDFNGEYVAILGGAVVDHDTDYSALATRVFSRHGVRSLYIPLVGTAPRVIRIHRPSLFSRARV